MIKLTPAQTAVLVAVAHGEVYTSYATRTLYKTLWQGRMVTRQTDALYRAGLIQYAEERRGVARYWELTDAGRAELKAEFPDFEFERDW